SALENVVAITTQNRVVPGSAVHHVVAGGVTQVDDVVAAIAVDDVVAVVANDGVVQVVAFDHRAEAALQEQRTHIIAQHQPGDLHRRVGLDGDGVGVDGQHTLAGEIDVVLDLDEV